MSHNLIEEIAAKAATLPLEQQREALALIEDLAQRTIQQAGKSFRSVKGVLQNEMNLEKLEADLAEVRSEMWRNFPREEPRS